jgi:hypothetical protein
MYGPDGDINNEKSAKQKKVTSKPLVISRMAEATPAPTLTDEMNEHREVFILCFGRSIAFNLFDLSETSHSSLFFFLLGHVLHD